LLGCLALACAGRAAATGPYIEPYWSDFSGPSFTSADYIVSTYYFYWYDIHTGYHITNGNGSDALTDHPDYSTPYPLGPGGYPARPPAIYNKRPPFSYREPAWHVREIGRMVGAKIDVMLPVYWGVPGVEDWSNEGLRTLEKAMDTLEAQKRRYPAVGMFYDTTTLNGVDLSTPAGKNQFYGTIRDFYSLIPPKRWARINGRAIVWLYYSGWPSRVDPAALSEASDRFASQFGGVRLFFVGDEGWRNAGATIDMTYSWGAAVNGPILKDVAAIGPGYNDSAVIYRPQPLIRPREDGAFYHDSWEAAHSSGRRLIALETWNEYHEGTEISPSFEYGWYYWYVTLWESTRHHFPAHFVRWAYRYFLGREPEYGGFLGWTGAISAGTPPSAIRDGILDSAEAKARTPNRQYVTFLYRQYLGRKPDQGGFDYWVKRLDQGAKRADVRNAFLDSAEAKAKISNGQFVTECYRQLLKREPESGGYNYWLGQLQAGATRAAVRDSFINSRELRYRDIENLNGRARTALFDFSARP